jgi:DNA-binding transcriptional MocR family regulator
VWVNKAEQLAQRLAERIGQQWLAPGARLPSVRECARLQGLSASTVVAAYERLLARGLIESRPQRGFFVRPPVAQGGPRWPLGTETGAPGPMAGRKNSTATPLPAPVDATALIRGMFQPPREGRPSPGMGTLPEDWLDAPLLHRALRRRVAGSAQAWLRYGEPAGDTALRTALCGHLGGLGIAATPQQLITSVGATQALDIVSRTVLAPGDAVLVDEPGWALEFARLSRLGMRLLPVPRSAAGDGPDLAVLERLLVAHRPRLYITVSVLHNPTGQCLSPASAYQVLRLAEQHGLLIAEDDSYAWLAPPQATRLAQLDGMRRCFYIGGFSKILAPQWRVGFVAAPQDWVQRLVDSKLLSTLTSPAPLEQALADTLTEGRLPRHAEQVRTRLESARARSVRLVLEAGCHFVSPPQGLFGWVDVGVDTERLALALLDDQWLIAPGTLFHATPRPTTFMRINFGASQDARFWRALRAARKKLLAR